ncbi:unnamed protein product [Parajaminaea phylloscopi]
MTSTAKPPALDHLIHLVEDLDEAIAVYSALGFLVVRGGTHADQLTTNALIVLPDGVYIELIAFVKSQDAIKVTGEASSDFETRRGEHWWYNRRQGWIDICLLGGATDGVCQTITQSDEAAIEYKLPQEGGRETLDGKTLAWQVTFPESQHPRGSVPFFCEDVTPREWRVPEMVSSHPNRASGVTGLTLLVRAENFLEAVKTWQLTLRNSARPDPSDGKNGARNAATIIDGQEAVQLLVSTPRSGPIKLTVKRAQDPQERQWIEENGEGVFEVEIGVSPGELPSSAPPDGVERTTAAKGYGRLRLHPVRA